MMSNNSFEDIGKILESEGWTLQHFLKMSAEKNSQTLNLDVTSQQKFKACYDIIEKKQYKSGEKGKKLEELMSILFQAYNELIETRRNCRTSSNEIDLLLDWSEKARISNLNSAFPCIENGFLCECKNYSKKVDVTYIGKFFSLLNVSDTKLGIMVSWEGVSGATSSWSYGVGLIKKIALKNNIYILVIDKDDLKKIYNGEMNIFSMIHQKYKAMQNNIDYSKYISKHDAEDSFTD